MRGTSGNRTQARAGKLRPEGRVSRVASERIPLPDHLARLINPAVYQERRAYVQQLLSDTDDASMRRERYVRTIVDHHLLETLKSA